MSLDDLLDRVKAAHNDHSPLRIRGGGSKDFYGGMLAGELFDVAPYAGILAYEPTELYITARCGTPLAEIEAELAGKGQMLAFEPPHFGAATIGGCIAAGLAGPRRQTAGGVRDFVLGVKLIDGTGQILDFGGQVMKNVAGYDVSRLLAGSLGTLGLIAEATLKVLPRPVAEQTLCFDFDAAESVARLNEWGGRPLPISASFGSRGACFSVFPARRRQSMRRAARWPRPAANQLLRSTPQNTGFRCASKVIRRLPVPPCGAAPCRVPLRCRSKRVCKRSNGAVPCAGMPVNSPNCAARPKCSAGMPCSTVQPSRSAAWTGRLRRFHPPCWRCTDA